MYLAFEVICFRSEAYEFQQEHPLLIDDEQLIAFILLRKSNERYIYFFC